MLARLQFGAYLRRLTVIEVLKVIVESFDGSGVYPALSPVADYL